MQPKGAVVVVMGLPPQPFFLAPRGYETQGLCSYLSGQVLKQTPWVEVTVQQQLPLPAESDIACTEGVEAGSKKLTVLTILGCGHQSSGQESELLAGQPPACLFPSAISDLSCRVG